MKRVHDKFKPPETFYYLGMPGTINPSSVKAMGQFLKEKGGVTDEEAAKSLADSKEKIGSYYYNNYLNTTFIKIFDDLDDVTVEVIF